MNHMPAAPFAGTLALDRPRTSRTIMAGVTLAHVGLLSLLLFAPASIAPVTPPRTLMVNLIEFAVEQPEPQPKPDPKPAPPRPFIKPLTPPPVLVAKRTLPTAAPVVEALRSDPAPEPVPEVLPPPAPVVEAPKPAPPPPPSQPSPPQTADYLANPKPPYPSLSRRLSEEGTVRLNILVNPDGSVARLELAKSSGHPRLDRSAMVTVQSSWKFEPARQAGKPVAAWVIVPIQFTLRS